MMAPQPEADTALARALAEIAANGSRFTGMKARVHNDPRYMALIAERDRCENRITMPGIYGGMQVFASLLSSRHYRARQAGNLAAARGAQMQGMHDGVRHFLERAAQFSQLHRKLLAVERGDRRALERVAA